MLDIQKIRKDFPTLRREVYGKPLIYLDNAATSQKPDSVIRSLVDYYENYNSNVHRGVHKLSMESTEKFEEAREKVARFINASSSNSIIWTRNATEAINLVANTWAQEHVNSGDEIVLTGMEHHSNLVPWQKVARDKQALLRYIPLTPDGRLDLMNIDDIICSRTKLVSIVHVSNSLGTINPVEELTAKARKVGASVLVDAAQSVPHMPVDVQRIDPDFLAMSGHKMLGPTGIGALYAKEDILENMEPFLRGGEMVLEVTYEDASWNSLPMRFEAGTPNIADAVGMGAAVDYLNAIGMKSIRQHEVDITSYALDAIKAINGLDHYGPEDMSQRGGVISFNSPGVHPHDLGTFLDRLGIAVRTGHHCTMPLMRMLGVPATTRTSFYLYNTKSEVDVFIEGLTEALGYFNDGSR
jgi:cysteine desulfurase/selenocysteine lyase